MAALCISALGLIAYRDHTHRWVKCSCTHAWTHCAVFTDRTLCYGVFSQVETFRLGKVRRLSVQIPVGGTCKLKINPSLSVKSAKHWKHNSRLRRHRSMGHILETSSHNSVYHVQLWASGHGSTENTMSCSQQCQSSPGGSVVAESCSEMAC